MPANAVHIEILSVVYSCLSSYQDVGVQSVEGKACEEEPQERQEGGGAPKKLAKSDVDRTVEFCTN